jgi:hypothetical protein
VDDTDPGTIIILAGNEIESHNMKFILRPLREGPDHVAAKQKCVVDEFTQTLELMKAAEVEFVTEYGRQGIEKQDSMKFIAVG